VRVKNGKGKKKEKRERERETWHEKTGGLQLSAVLLQLSEMSGRGCAIIVSRNATRE